MSRNRHARERAHDLEGSADARFAQLMRLAGEHVAALEQDFAAIGPQEAIQQIEQRGLAGAVRADDAEDLVSVELEADVLDGLQPAERRREIADLENDIYLPGGLIAPRQNR